MKFKKISASIKKYSQFVSVRIEKWPLLASFFVFVFFLGINSVIYFTVRDVSSYDDQWFHFKYAYLLRTEGWNVVHNFKWLYFTNLAQDNLNYGVTLYHYFLIPFTYFDNKILGLKLSGLFFSAIVPAIFYFVFRGMNIKKPFLWLLFFYVFASYNVIWRLLINRNFVLTEGLFLLEIYFIYKRKYIPLFFTAFFHTWWHPATFWVAPFLAISYEIFYHLNFNRTYYKNIFVGTTGAFLGFWVFPPNSDHLFSSMNPASWLKTLPTFFYGVQEGIGVSEGVEVYKRDFMTYVANNHFMFFAFVFLVVINIYLYIYKKKNENIDLDSNRERVVLREFLFFVSVLFFLGLTSISMRFEDFLAPTLLLVIIFIIQFINNNKIVQVSNILIRKTLYISAVIIIAYLFVDRSLTIRNSYGGGQKYLKYEKAGQWLKTNTKKDEIIFNTNWSSFPPLFFYDDWNRYVVGIEPMSLYRYNPEMYWYWHNISLNGVACSYKDCAQEQKETNDLKSSDFNNELAVKESEKIFLIIKNNFKSSYVFFDDNRYLKKVLDSNKNKFELAYSDDSDNVYIYRLK